MAHPFAEHRQNKVEKSRVGHITRGYANGGAVHSDEKQDRKLFGKMIREHDREPEGKKGKRRADRVTRAKGGRVKKGATHVNVIVNGGGDKQPVPVPVPAPAMAGPPPGPPMPPVAGLGGPPPGMPPMPPRARGGKVNRRADGGVVDDQTAQSFADRVRAGDTRALTGFGRGSQAAQSVAKIQDNLARGQTPRARGGSVKSGPAYEEGKRLGTHVQHSDGKGTTNTPANLDRGRPITFKSGGKVKSFYARGGKVEADGKPGKQMGPDLKGGVVSGEARLEQAGRAKRNYANPIKEAEGK